MSGRDRTACSFQSCLAAAVRGPERFLGRVCSYGACLYLLAGLSRRRSKAYSIGGDNSHSSHCPMPARVRKLRPGAPRLRPEPPSDPAARRRARELRRLAAPAIRRRCPASVGSTAAERRRRVQPRSRSTAASRLSTSPPDLRERAAGAAGQHGVEVQPVPHVQDGLGHGRGRRRPPAVPASAPGRRRSGAGSPRAPPRPAGWRPRRPGPAACPPRPRT